MTTTYVNPACTQPNQCDTLALMCVDFRFWKQTTDLLSNLGYGDIDLLCFPGSSRAVIDESHRSILFQSLETIHCVHSTKRLILVDHIDCGAYGGSVLFKDAEEEEAFHTEKLLNARDIISAQYASLEVIPAYIDWNQFKLLR